MELLLLAGSWWIVGFSGAMMPGPVTTLIVTESARRGFWMGPLVTLGHVLLELLIVVGLVFGLEDVLKNPTFAGMIGLLGGVFLLWMGYGIIRSAWSGQVSLDLTASKASTTPATNPVAAGLLMSISNPYMLLWWSTVGAASLFTFRAFGFAGIVAFYLGHTLADWTWNSLVSFLVSTGRRFIGDRTFRGVLIVCGAFLLVLAVYFISSGLQFLSGWLSSFMLTQA